MGSFKEFVKQHDMEEEKQDIAKTLSKLPPSHAALVQGFRWKFHPGNTLNGDDRHVGYIDELDKEIAVAAPWNYGREFTILHEVGHKVWEHLPDQLKKQWLSIVSHMTPLQKKEKSVHQEPEEVFCMSYAQHYADNKTLKYYNPVWDKFIKNLPQ